MYIVAISIKAQIQVFALVSCNIEYGTWCCWGLEKTNRVHIHSRPKNHANFYLWCTKISRPIHINSD